MTVASRSTQSMHPDSPATKDDLNTAVQAVMDEITEFREEVRSKLGTLDEVRSELATLEEVQSEMGTLKALTVGSPDPERHRYVIFPIGGSYLGSCSGCSWQRGASVESDIHDLFREHHAEFLAGWREREAGGSSG